jgi:hypothetical protein
VALWAVNHKIAMRCARNFIALLLDARPEHMGMSRHFYNAPFAMQDR